MITKKFILSITLIVLQALAFAQDKYFVAFCADGGVPGHAFISIGRESSSSSSSINDGVWGLYPSSSSQGAKSFVIGAVPGYLKDDFLRNVDYVLSVEVGKDDYDRVKSTINKWKNKNYELLENDCLSFVIEVANILSGKITIPQRQGFENFPAKYLKNLIDSN